MVAIFSAALINLWPRE